MCHSCNDKIARETCACCRTSLMNPDDEIRMLEAVKSVQEIRLNAIDRKIQSLKQTRNK